MKKVSRHLPLIVLAAIPLLFCGVIKATAEQKGTATIDALIQKGKYEHYRREQVVKSRLDIQISPLVTVLRSSQSQGHDGKRRTVLVLPLKVTNKSQQIVTSEIAHEWYGGEWPPTDLHVYMMIKGQSMIQPVFLVGEKGSRTKATTLRPGESTHLDLRMDWPGTGSVRGRVLMQADKSATYDLRVVLFFTGNEKKQYVISPEMRIKVVRKSSLSRTATVTSHDSRYGGFELLTSKVNRKVDSRRLNALRSKRQLVEAYLTAVDKSVTSLLKGATIPNMTRRDWRHDWRKDLDRNLKRQSFRAYSASLWGKTKQTHNTVYLTLHCNIQCDDGEIRTPMAPDPWIRKPARDLRFDWYIKTGNRGLDKKIKDIVVAQAKRF